MKAFFWGKAKYLVLLLSVTLFCAQVGAETIYIPKEDFDFEDMDTEVDENLTRALGKMGYEIVDFSDRDLTAFLKDEGLFEAFAEAAAYSSENDIPQFIMLETGLSGTKYLMSEIYFDDVDDLYFLAVHDFEPVVFDQSTLGKTNMLNWAVDNILVLLVFVLLGAFLVLFTKYVFPRIKAQFPVKFAEDALEEHMENAKWWKRKYKWSWKKERNGIIIRLTNGVLVAALLAEVIILGSILYSGITTYTVQKLIPAFSGTREEIEIQAANYIAENITYQEGVHGDLSMGYTVYLFRFIPIPIPICFPPDSYKVINDKLGDCDEMTFLWMKMLQKSGVFGVKMAISETEQHAWAYDTKTGLYWDVTWYENSNRKEKWLQMPESFYPVEKTLITL
jgi:hypothetical protein